MALRILWDQYETALLIDTWLAVAHGNVSRREGVSNLSRTLRERAVEKGIVIDETFRNENGISMQLNNIDRLMRRLPDAERHNTRIFIDMVDMYFTDRGQFNAILHEAKGDRIHMMDNQERFAHWLSANVSPNRLSDCFMAITDVEGFAQRKKIISGALYDVTNPSVTAKIVNALNADRIFRFTHKKKIRNIVEAAQLFHKYTKENQAERNEEKGLTGLTESDVAEAQRDSQPEAQRDSQPEAQRDSQPEIQLMLVHPVVAVREPNTELPAQEAPVSMEEPEVTDTHDEEEPEAADTHDEEEPEAADTHDEEEPEAADTHDAEEPEAADTHDAEEPVHMELAEHPGESTGDYLILDFKQDTDLAFTKPVSFSYFGVTVSVTSWRKLYIKICGALWEDYPYVLQDHRFFTAVGDGRHLFYDEETSKRLASPVAIADGCYVETNRNASTFIRNIKYLLDSCNVDYENLEIRYRRLVKWDIEQVGKMETAGGRSAFPDLHKERRGNHSVTRTDFINWLKQEGLAKQTASGYAASVAVAGEYARNHGYSSAFIFDISDVHTVSAIWRKLQEDTEFFNYNYEQHNRFSAAMKKYIDFCASNQGNVSGSSAQNHSYRPLSGKAAVGATRADRLASIKHPVQTEFENWLLENRTPQGSVKTYSSAVKRIGDYLLETKREDRHLYSIFGIARLEKIRQELQSDSACGELPGKIDILDLYALRKYISFRKNDPSDAADGELYGRYSTVLRENFDNGYRVNSMIDRNRFKQYYLELYGADIQQDDELLVETIRQIGQIQDGRVFVRGAGVQSDLLDDIQAAIAKAFHQGASCVFVAAVFERYQNELASQLQIYSEDVLQQQLLDTCYGFYRMTKNYFYIRGKAPNADADVAQVMKQSQLPLSYRQVHEILWYFPLDIIKHSLVVNADMVNVAQETYFYAQNLPISTEEQEKIADIIHTQLTQKNFITDTELRSLIEKHCPSVAINTEGFTTWGLRNVLGVLLRGRFSFKGTIISERGQEINISQAFEAFCASRDELTLQELRDFAKEMNTVIYWDSVFNQMIRISRTEYVRKNSILFPVEETDAVLDMLLDGDYVPIRKFSLFLHFPPIAVKWNEFVLEGYVAQYSRDFVLLHAGYTANECYGAIVRRISTIKDFKGLVVDVLSNEEGWKTQDDALDLLVQKGYLQRKRYSEIEAATAEARILRERIQESETKLL